MIMDFVGRDNAAPVGQFFGESKVGDLEVTVAIQQQVLWFQVAIDDVLCVKIVESADDFARVEIT